MTKQQKNPIRSNFGLVLTSRNSKIADFASFHVQKSPMDLSKLQNDSPAAHLVRKVFKKRENWSISPKIDLKYAVI